MESERPRSRRPARALPLGAAVLAATCAGCVAGSREVIVDQPMLEADELGAMTNVYVSGDLWIGSRPCVEDLRLAARRGVQLVVDLCTDGERGFDAEAVCTEAGLEYYAVPIALDRLDDHDVDAVIELLEDAEGRPTLMFSKSGSDAAMFLAIYRGVKRNLRVADALATGRRAGMKPGAPGEHVREQMLRLRL